jgi:subtilisin family serine protease
VPAQVLVGYEPGASAAERDRAAARAKAVRRERVGHDVDIVHLRAGASNASAIARIEEDPAVAYAEPDWRLSKATTSNDPLFTGGSLWGMSGGYGSRAADAWAQNVIGSSAVYVGVIDEGIQVTHPDLSGNAWANPYDPVDGVDNDGNGFVDDTNGWDFATGDRSVYDGGTKGRLDAHGTHVAGTIGAEGGNAIGVAGVNWDVTYISGKFLGRSGGTTANAIRALDYMTDLKTRHGLNLVATNNSWGGGGFSQGLQDAIRRGGAAGILFIAAAGNGGSDGVGDNNDTTANYPSNYTCPVSGTDCVIAVASITSSGARSSFSNYGAATVDLGAPGSGIYSTLPFNKYGSYSGTSMATPHVTGAAALYAASHAGATLFQIRNAILSSTAATASLNGTTVTGGRLDISAALTK